MIAGKVWGSTALLLATPTVEIHALRVLPNAFCSLHRHLHRWNAFVGTMGRLFVEVHQADYDLVDVTEVTPGVLMTVKPGLLHRFRTESEGAECLEVYYPSALGHADIERKGVGGRING